MRAGRLDRRVKVLSRVEQKNASTGEIVPVWVPMNTYWARRVPKGAAERVLGRELVSEETTVWSFRYNTNIDAKKRLQYASEQYRILGVYEGNDRRDEILVLTIKEDPERQRVDE